MIMYEFKAHPIAYAILVVCIGLFIASFLWVWPDHVLERVVIAAFATFYFFWGLCTHNAKKQMTSRLVSEYAIVSILGAVLLLMLTF